MLKPKLAILELKSHIKRFKSVILAKVNQYYFFYFSNTIYFQKSTISNMSNLKIFELY